MLRVVGTLVELQEKGQRGNAGTKKQGNSIRGVNRQGLFEPGRDKPVGDIVARTEFNQRFDGVAVILNAQKYTGVSPRSVCGREWTGRPPPA